jgi:hypothetical protein
MSLIRDARGTRRRGPLGSGPVMILLHFPTDKGACRVQYSSLALSSIESK